MTRLDFGNVDAHCINVDASFLVQSPRMAGFELFMLGRKLMKLGEQAMPETGFRQLSAPARMVLFDIAENPDSSISDVTARVRFPQSQVSACVARLRDNGVV